MQRQLRRFGIVAALLAYVLFILIKLAVYDFDVSRFVVAGDHFFSKADLTYPIYVEPNSDGYDGQFYYRLALNPLTTQRTEFGITMEKNPVVRDQRILYPLVIWLASGGNGRLVPMMMVLVNLASLVLLMLAAMSFARQYSIPRWLAILIPLYPGFVLSICRDTGEIFATLFAFSAVLAAVKKKYAIAALLAAAAVLSRETTLFYLAGFGIVSLFDRFGSFSSIKRTMLCAVPLIVFVLWQAILHRIWGNLPVQDLGPHDLSAVPFVEYFRWVGIHFGKAATYPMRYSRLYTAVTILFVPSFLLFMLYRIARSRGRPVEIVIPWGLYSALMIFFTGAIWIEPYGYLRVMCDFYILGVAVLMANRDERALLRLVPLVAVTWFATAMFAL